MLNPQQVAAALATDDRPKPEIITLSPAELRRVHRKLGFRWVQNLLRGKPEPRFPNFDVRAVAIIRDTSSHRVLTLTGKHGRVLPRVRCGGLDAPWIELTTRIRHHCGVNPTLQWVGIWQDATNNVIELIFAATLPERALKPAAEWSTILNTSLSDRDIDYVELTGEGDTQNGAWLVEFEGTVGNDDVILSSGTEV